MHTPTPWKLWPNRERTNPIICVGDDPLTYRGIVEVRGATPEEMNANAAFILRAANSHATLLAACEAALPCLEINEVEDSRTNRVIRQLEAAIAAAR